MNVDKAVCLQPHPASAPPASLSGLGAPDPYELTAQVTFPLPASVSGSQDRSADSSLPPAGAGRPHGEARVTQQALYNRWPPGDGHSGLPFILEALQDPPPRARHGFRLRVQKETR